MTKKKDITILDHIEMHDRGADRKSTKSGLALYVNGELRAVDDTGTVALPLRLTARTPVDVRNDIASPQRGYEAYHDGSGSNTEGPAFYNGSSWVSVVDGTTIS